MSAAHLPAGLMGIDKGHKDQSPLLFIYPIQLTWAGEQVDGDGARTLKKMEWYNRIVMLFLTTWLLEWELSIMQHGFTVFWKLRHEISIFSLELKEYWN